MSDDRGLAALLRERIGSEFDDEAHLSGDEAQSIAATIERLLAEVQAADLRTGAASKVALEMTAERDEARLLVAEANNSLYGSQGYFHSLNGGPFDRYHLASGIEKLKQTSNRHWHERQEAEAQRDKLKEALEHVTELLVDTWSTAMDDDPEREMAVSCARQALQDT